MPKNNCFSTRIAKVRLTPAVTPQPAPTPETTPTPAECVAEKMTLSSTRLKFKINQITEITATVNGNNDCPVEGEMVETKITTGRKYVSVLPMSQETDNNGQAAFTITARKKPGNARVTFMLGGITEISNRAGGKIVLEGRSQESEFYVGARCIASKGSRG